jgi:hypothetical protein
MLSDIFLSGTVFTDYERITPPSIAAGDISTGAIIMQIFGSLNNKFNPDMDYRIYIPLDYHT